MKKIISIFVGIFVALSILPMSIAKADNTPCFQGVRPHIGEIEDEKLVISIPILPLVGSTNFLNYGEIKKFIDAATNFRLPDEGSDFERLQGFIDTINNFHGANANLYMMVLPSAKLEVNTKYFELKVFGGAKSYASAKLRGLSRQLSVSDIQFDQNSQPYVTGLQQRVLELRNVNLFGAEAWAIGKIPINIEDYKLTLLFGVGSVVAYRMTYSLTLDLEDTVTAGSGFIREARQQHDLLWNINAMVGLQLDGKWFRPRVVVQVRDIYNGYDKRSKPLVDVGLHAKLGKRFGLHAELYDAANPQARFEGTFSFLKNSEVALGGMFYSEYPGKHYGYAVLGLGSSVIKWTLMVIFNQNSLGAFMGLNLNIGWSPERKGHDRKKS